MDDNDLLLCDDGAKRGAAPSRVRRARRAPDNRVGTPHGVEPVRGATTENTEQLRIRRRFVSSRGQCMMIRH